VSPPPSPLLIEEPHNLGMAKSSTTPMRSRLERARSAQNGIRLVRSIPGADVIKAYVLDVGSKWVLMAAVDETRVDGYVAVRVRDIERIQPLKADAFYRKASELAGVWPPALPASPIDLSTTRALIETAHVHATLVNLQIEREDPDIAFIGVPTRWSPKKLWLHEVSPRAIWDDTDSKWAFADITRVEFSSTYENDLLLVAGPPPDR
jgi:hypothetical protein